MLYEQVNTDQNDLLLFIVTEFCPGCPCEGGCEFCPSHKCSSMHIEQLDAHSKQMCIVEYDLAKELYKKITGKKDRISYWLVLKDMKGELL